MAANLDQISSDGDKINNDGDLADVYLGKGRYKTLPVGPFPMSGSWNASSHC